MSRLSLRVSDDRKRELVAFCAQPGHQRIGNGAFQSPAAHGGRAIHALREQMLPAGSDAGYMTDDAVFEDIS